MSRAETGPGRSLRAVESLHRIRELQSRRARVVFQEKQGQVRSLRAQIERVRTRRDAVIRRGGALDLEGRKILDALARIALEKGREVRVLELQAAILLDAYREARARSDAVGKLRDRRRDERETALRRRAEEAAGDAAAWRAVQERQGHEEAACEG